MPDKNEEGSGSQDEKKKEQDPPAGDGKKDEGGEGSGSSGAKDSKKTDDADELAKVSPEELRKMVKDLRGESAKHRTRAKNLEDSQTKLKTKLVEAGFIEDDSKEPAEQLESFKQATAELQVKNAILQAAVENGISKDGVDYFEFLVNKKLGALEEGAEITSDDLAAWATEAKKKFGGGSGGSTSVGADGKKNPNGDSSVTLDQFVKMSTGEKSSLFNKDRAAYDQLFSQAKSKGLLKSAS